MNVLPLPEPARDWPLSLIDDIADALSDVLGDLTVGELIAAVTEVPVRDIINTLHDEGRKSA